MLKPSEIKAGEPKQTVFVIDDDNDVREGLRSLLQSIGLGCEVFATTKEFLNRKTSNEISCLILDVRLPGPSGLDFQAELARARVNIPIIFISGHGDIAMAVRAMAALPARDAQPSSTATVTQARAGRDRDALADQAVAADDISTS